MTAMLSDEQAQVALSRPPKKTVGQRMFGSARKSQWHFTLLLIILLAFVAYIPLELAI